MIVRVLVSHSGFRAGEVVRVISWDPWTEAKIKSGYFKILDAEEVVDVPDSPRPVRHPTRKTGRRKAGSRADVPAVDGGLEADGTTEPGAPVGVEEAEAGSPTS